MPDVYFTSKDLEARFKVSRATIKKWRDMGMPSFKIGNSIRFNMEEVEQWVREQNKK